MRRLLFSALLVLGLKAFAAQPAERFSADQVMSVQGRQLKGRIFVDGGNMRSETAIEGGPEMVSIVNAEQQVVWILMPGNMYLENAVAQDDDVSRKAWTDADSRELLGSETINGQVCDKFRIKGAQDLYFYANQETGLPVLMTSADGKVRIEWSNAKEGPQPAALFQLPAGYQKLAMPSLFKLPGMN